jgi:hypothetical protein
MLDSSIMMLFNLGLVSLSVDFLVHFRHIEKREGVGR